MTAAAFAPFLPFTPTQPCPICGGHERLPKHHGRCWGGISGDYAYCTREEYAGALTERKGKYRHLIEGRCECGQEHGLDVQTFRTSAAVAHVSRDGQPERSWEAYAMAFLVPPSTWDAEPEVTGWRRFPVKDATGKLHATLIRKDLRLVDGTPDKDVWFQGGLNGVPVEDLPLYKSELIAQLEPTAVVVTEGGAAADALWERKIPAAGTMTGAHGCPSDESLSVLKGHTVLLWADNDREGFDHMRRIGSRLAALGIKHADVDWPAPRKGDDAADFDGDTDELIALLHAALFPKVEPKEPRPRRERERSLAEQKDRYMNANPRVHFIGKIEKCSTGWYRTGTCATDRGGCGRSGAVMPFAYTCGLSMCPGCWSGRLFADWRASRVQNVLPERCHFLIVRHRDDLSLAQLQARVKEWRAKDRNNISGGVQGFGFERTETGLRPYITLIIDASIPVPASTEVFSVENVDAIPGIGRPSDSREKKDRIDARSDAFEWLSSHYELMLTLWQDSVELNYLIEQCKRKRRFQSFGVLYEATPPLTVTRDEEQETVTRGVRVEANHHGGDGKTACARRRDVCPHCGAINSIKWNGPLVTADEVEWPQRTGAVGIVRRKARAA